MRQTMLVLVVKSAFRDYQVGNVISDEATIKSVLESEQKIHVIAAEHAVDRVFASAPESHE